MLSAIPEAAYIPRLIAPTLGRTLLLRHIAASHQTATSCYISRHTSNAYQDTLQSRENTHTTGTAPPATKTYWYAICLCMLIGIVFVAILFVVSVR
jgi:hypothetical protein